MTIEDILTLARAGYSSAQINALYSAQVAQPQPQQAAPAIPQQVQPPVQVPAAEAAPSPVAVPAQVPAPMPSPVPAGATLDDVMRSIAGLTTAVQANAILGAQQPAQPTVNDVLAQIIAPNPPAKG